MLRQCSARRSGFATASPGATCCALAGWGWPGWAWPTCSRWQDAGRRRGEVVRPRSFGRAKSIILIHLYGSPSQIEWVDPQARTRRWKFAASLVDPVEPARLPRLRAVAERWPR